ncbi:hypothetical protein ANTHELSMS3_02490 [Antarctobacter heliothermus]|uniref:Uncharacterized protein n=1 Tax=Antarctobacter heliothermus TaxID=74033 RepID=A0A222E4L4_9RHOB|nr:hypothetical protein [Antarctobacter heliothermus]ASP21154.1 hypothetical protein ANTHELSMS3_02490 [Antarctobacter heliothermus]
MTDQDMLRSETLKGLATLQQHGKLAARAGATCASLLEKLDRPVRIGLFGLPGAGKRRVLHALTGLTVADHPGWAPTLEITYGPVPATTAMMVDGGRLEASGLPDPALLAQQPVFLQVTSPDKALVGRCVLLVSTEANAEDLQAALTWAAPRIDIALWCTVDWSEAERQVWHTAPDSLRNHAILFVTGKGQRRSDPAADGFETRFSSAGQSGAESFSELATYLDRTIKDACLHDIHAAQMFLQRNGALSARPSLPAPPSQADEVTQTATIPRPASPAVAPQVPPEAIAELARLFQAVRTSAQDMLRRLYDGTAGNTDTLLMQFEQIFEALADRVTGDVALQETWPDLATQVTQAHDLALLLRIEGGAEQLGDAAHLLVQVRHDIQERLAA